MSLQANVAAAFAECNETRRLIIAWRDARQAIIDKAAPMQFTAPELVAALADAEHALMDYAQSFSIVTVPAKEHG